MKKDVLLIVIDTARAKSFSSLGNKTNTTPALDAFGKQGMFFTRCFSPAPWTVPSHASIFTGKYPSEHGTHGRNISFNAPDNLAMKFKRNGYKTFGISANRLVSSLNGFHKGFDVFLDPWTPFKEMPLEQGLDLSKPQVIKRSFTQHIRFILSKEGINAHFKKRFGVNQNATYSTNRAIRFVKRVFSSNRGTRKFIFVNIMQPHERYNPPRRFVKNLGYEYEAISWPDILGYYAGKHEIDAITTKVMQSLYEGEIHYADEKIGKLIEWMKKRKYLDNTIVIVTSDHGEHIGEHGHYTHFFSMYNELLHVPLIIYHPDYLGVGQKDDLVQLHDLYQTLMEDVFGAYDEFKNSDGKMGINIFTDRRKKAISQLIYPLWIKGVINRNSSINEDTSALASRKLSLFQYNDNGLLEKICWDSHNGIVVYNIENDYEERKPLPLSPIEQKKREEAIYEVASKTNFNLGEEARIDVTEETKRHLVDLGYM